MKSLLNPQRNPLPLLISIILFLISLTQDGYYIEGSDPRAWSPAWALLLFGWLGVMGGVFAWFANPLLIVAYKFMRGKSYLKSCVCSLLSLCFAVSFLLHDNIISSEAPTYSKITGYGYGYWLWLASISTMLIGSIYIAIKNKKELKIQQTLSQHPRRQEKLRDIHT